MFYSIGKFSRICRLSSKTLRYYESIGLLFPDSVNAETGYRYYSSRQVYEVIAVENLKEMGFTLKEIKMVLGRSSSEEREKIVNDKILELNREKEELLKTIDTLEREKNNIVSGMGISGSIDDYEVHEGIQCEVTVLSRRETVNMENISGFIDEMFRLMFRKRLKPTGPVRTYYYDEEFDPDKADLEVCIPVEPNVALNELEIKGPHKTAFTTYRGRYSEISKGYAAVIDYVEKNSYIVCASPYEKYLIGYESGLNQDEYVTEIHFPIGR